MEIKVKGSTYAMKGKQVLNGAGIRAYVGKRNGDEGCYYYLNVSEKKVEEAYSILERNGISIIH